MASKSPPGVIARLDGYLQTMPPGTMSYAQVGALFHITGHTVAYRVKALGLPYLSSNYNRVPAERLNAIRAIVESSRSWEEARTRVAEAGFMNASSIASNHHRYGKPGCFFCAGHPTVLVHLEHIVGVRSVCEKHREGREITRMWGPGSRANVYERMACSISHGTEKTLLAELQEVDSRLKKEACCKYWCYAEYTLHPLGCLERRKMDLIRALKETVAPDNPYIDPAFVQAFMRADEPEQKRPPGGGV